MGSSSITLFRNQLMINIEGPLLYELYSSNLFFLNYEYVEDRKY